MSLKNTDQSYGWLAKAFHWVIALCIISLLIVGNIMADMERGDTRSFIYGIHKSTGMLVLALVIGRICWRIVNTQPSMKHLARWQSLAAHIVHYALYAAMFLMPLSGWVMSSAGGHPIRFFGLFTIPPLVEKDEALARIMNERHETIGWIIVALLIAHIGAALLHHFHYKDSTLKRMLP